MRLIDVDGFTKRYKIEEKYTSLYTKFVIQEGTTCENPGAKLLLEDMEHSGFFSAPASTRYQEVMLEDSRSILSMYSKE